MMFSRISKKVAVFASTGLLVTSLAACSSKSDTSETKTVDGVKVGVGVTDKTISIGGLVVLTGPFAAAGQATATSMRLFWDKQNENGGVCGRTVELDFKDMQYDVQKSVTLYNQMRGNILAMQVVAGSPMMAALAGNVERDKILTIPAAWSGALLKKPNVMVVATTYALEMVNGIDHLIATGKLKKGDTLGHIYNEGEYGEDGAAGSKYAAEAAGLKYEPVKVAGTAADMSAQVLNLKQSGVDAIAVTTGATQLASIASASQSVGLRVPIVATSNAWSPDLLKGPAAKVLQERANVMTSWLMPDSEEPAVQDFVKRFRAEAPKTPLGVTLLWANSAAEAMQKTLQKACDNNDLTREGVLSAAASTTNLETDFIVPLDVSGEKSPSNKVRIYRPDSGEVGGLKQITKEPYEGPNAAGYSN